MRHVFDASMNGVSLISLGDIYITDIIHQPAQLEVVTAPLAMTHGEHVLNKTWKKAQVSIEFLLLGSSPAAQQVKCQAVMAWAKDGGHLETSDRSSQYLECICTEPPKISSAMNRVERVKMTFTAYETPFWSDLTQSSATLSGTNASSTLYVPGNADMTMVEIEAAPNSGTLNNLTLTVGNTTIVLNGLGATQSNKLTITYSHKLQRIKVGNVSALSKRTGASADDLIATCGASNVISMQASVASTVRFIARGKWL